MTELIHLKLHVRNYMYHAALFAYSSGSKIILGISQNIKYFTRSHDITSNK